MDDVVYKFGLLRLLFAASLIIGLLSPSYAQQSNAAQEQIEKQIGQLVVANAQCGMSVQTLQQQLTLAYKERDDYKAQLEALYPKEPKKK